MTQKVTFVVDAQQRAAIDAFLQIGQAADAVAAKGNRAGNTMAQGANAAGDAWDKGLKVLMGYPIAFGKMLTGAMGVYAALGQIRSEFERIKGLQEKAMTSLDQAQNPYNKLRQSVSPEFSKSAKLHSMIRSGMQDYGSENPAEYLELAATMESARGMMPEVKAMDAVNTAAKLVGVMGMPAEDAAEFGGAMLDAQNVQQAHGRNYTPKQVAGKFLSMYGVTRSTSIGQFARYDMRTINSMARHGFSMDEAIGFQSAIAGSKPDPMGRISATGMGLLMGDISKAYASASDPSVRMGVKGLDPLDFEKSGMKMFDIARSDTNAGHYINAYMYGNRALHPKAKALAQRSDLGFGPGFMGHARGESGMFELSRELLDPKSELFERARKATGEVVSDAGAEQRYDDVVGGKVVSPHDKYYRGRSAVRGAIGVSKWGQVTQASRGGLVSMQSELADLLKTSAIGQTINGNLTSLFATGATPEEIDQQGVEIIKRGIGTIRGTAALRAVHKKYGYGNEGAPGPVSEQEVQAQLREDDRNLMEALERLIETLENQKVEVTVQDPTGRDVGRSTSRPRSVNGLGGTPTE